MNMPPQGQPQGPPSGYSGQLPGQPPQGPPSGPIPAQPGAPTQQFQVGQGAAWQPAGPPKPQRPPVPRVISAIWILGLVSIAATVIGLSVSENGANAWHAVKAWGGLAIVGAILTLTPALAGSFNMSARRAWQVAACGAGALVLFWVLLVLPAVGTNTSLIVTIGVAAGVIAACIAPGREAASADAGSARADQHSW
jgi:hypothetical protein